MNILELSDKVTPFILNEPELSKHAHFLASRDCLSFINNKDWEHCLNQLQADNYIALIPGSDTNHFSITSSGRIFMEKGGYKNKLLEEEKKEKLSNDLIKSSIETNLSVNKTNNKINTYSLISSIVAIAALLVAAIPLFTKNSDNKLLKQTIHNQEIIIQQNKYLKSLIISDSSKIIKKQEK